MLVYASLLRVYRSYSVYVFGFYDQEKTGDLAYDFIIFQF